MRTRIELMRRLRRTTTCDLQGKEYLEISASWTKDLYFQLSLVSEPVPDVTSPRYCAEIV